MFFHADLGLDGGYVGVDVFFVISGYLITGLILRDLDSGQFGLIRFWERRVRRLLPALVVVVVATTVAGWFLFLPLDFKELGQSVFAQALLISNIYFWRESGYFAQAADIKPLLHTWSLAVEEQYYLLFPVVIIGLRRISPKCLLPGVFLLCLLSFILSVACTSRNPSFNFYLLPTRAWELLLGAILASIPKQPDCSRRLAEALSITGFLMILWPVIWYNRQTPFPGVSASLPCVGTALVLWTNDKVLTSVGRLLAARPLVFCGLISYSLYLWHWPLLVFLKYSIRDQISATQRGALMLITIILAVMSWRYVETTFRARRILAGRLEIFTFAAIATVTLLIAGLAIHRTNGVPSRIPASALKYANAVTEHSFRAEMGPKEVVAEKFVELGYGDKHRPVDIVVWGDSHAMALAPVLDVLCKEYSIRGLAATHSSTAPLLGYTSTGRFALHSDSVDFNNAVVEFIRRKNVPNVILVAVWSGYVVQDGMEAVRQAMFRTIQALEASGAKVWVVREVPKHPWNVPKVLASAVWHRRGSPETLGMTSSEFREQFERQSMIFRDVASRSSNVTVMDPTRWFLDSEGRFRIAAAGESLYADNHHLSVAGAMMVKPMFEPIFVNVRTGFSPRSRVSSEIGPAGVQP